MGKFKISKQTIDLLEKAGKDAAKKLSVMAKKEIEEKYISLIDFYYADYMPKLKENGKPYYYRSFGLYRSYKPFSHKDNHGNIFYGGITVTGEPIGNYPSLKSEYFSGTDLMEIYIYNESGTWHGGDWHGGYGIKNSFNIYDEMKSFQIELIEKYKKKYGFSR